MAVLPTGIGPVTGYNIERSLRFNSADSAYLNRTFSTPTSNTVWSWSCWLKRSTLASTSFILGLSSDCGFGFTSTDELRLWNNAGTTLVTSTAVFRDVSAWYHIVFISNGTTIKGYVNNAEYLSYTGTVTNINSAIVHNIGRDPTGTRFYVGGYMTEVYFVDGQALTPSSFGETDASTGVWKPKAYSGTYGTNGFFLKFADNSGTTSTTLGKDSSGNGNNWTPNNFSVTAGAGNDSLVDSPTAYGTDTGVGGTVRGYYATWNPLDRTAATYANGNLEVTSTSNAAPYNMQTTIQLPTSGKWYCEVTALKGANSPAIGIGNNRPTDQFAMYRSPGSYITSGISGTSSSGTPASWTTGDIIGIAYDADAGTLSFYKNGTAQSGGFTSIPATGYFIAVRADSASGDGGTLNAGQRAFAYTAPSGFKALCTTNLPTPTIGATSTTQANDYFNTVLYTGNGSTQSITGVGFQPDWVWVKSRSSSGTHSLTDAVRGVNKQLFTNLTDAEGSQTDQVTAFNSDGFSLGANVAGTGSVNVNTVTYAAWNWNAGGSNATNTAGTITSTVRANTTSGFSIVTFTTNNTAGATVGHGLGAVPDMIIMKYRGLAANWVVYHKSMNATPQNGYLNLNTTAGYAPLIDPWNNTAPSSTVITMGAGAGSAGSTNYSVYTSVAYCFSAVAGYSAFGSYTGNGDPNGPFVYTGFRPRYVLIKKTATGAGNAEWYVHDTARDDYNQARFKLYPSSAVAENGVAGETTTTNAIDILSNGFKLRTGNGATNESAIVYIYAAFAEHPFKYSLAR